MMECSEAPGLSRCIGRKVDVAIAALTGQLDFRRTVFALERIAQ